MHSDETNESSSGTGIYGSFRLGNSEFALMVDSIQEVVNEPSEYCQIPLSPAYLLGLFNLRGIIVPVVDLRKIFDAQDPNVPTDESRKVAIVEHGSLCLGLLFDATGEVFNERNGDRCLFESRGTDLKDQVVQGVFKFDDGRRIVQILDAHATLNLEKLPRTGNLQRASVANRGTRKQCISFVVGLSHCAIDIGAIKEVVDFTSIDDTALSSSFCPGVIDIRGSIVPIVDFAALLGCDTCSVPGDSEQDALKKIIVMKLGNELFGLLVDAVENIISYFDDEMVPFPVLSEKKRALFMGCISDTELSTHTIVLNHDAILSNDEINTITKGHSHIYRDTSDVVGQPVQSGVNRKSLILFSLDAHYGLDISDVQEVIDYPEEMIKTPGMPRHMQGMINLRGELVAVIDSRMMYGLEELSNPTKAKVLVFENSGVKHGLIVDSVDSIVPFADAEAIAIPSIMSTGSKGAISEDVQKAILVKKGDRKETICILDLSSVSTRASM